jgi:hypothetical protein
MKKYLGSTIFVSIAASLFIIITLIAVDPNAAGQTRDDLRQHQKDLEHEKAAIVGSVNDPAEEPQLADTSVVAKTSHDTPTFLFGKVLDAEDRAVARTVITLTEADGNMHTTTSDSFGNFRFDKVFGGQQVVLSADAGAHTFSDLAIGLDGETTVSWRTTTK